MIRTMFRSSVFFRVSICHQGVKGAHPDAAMKPLGDSENSKIVRRLCCWSVPNLLIQLVVGKYYHLGPGDHIFAAKVRNVLFPKCRRKVFKQPQRLMTSCLLFRANLTEKWRTQWSLAPA
jgi:hypothetical protein